MKVNYYGEVLKLNKVNDNLWISNVIEEDVCVVFQRYEGAWDHGFYTTDEVDSLFNPYNSYHLTDDMIDQILADTDSMLDAWAVQYGINNGGEQAPFFITHAVFKRPAALIPNTTSSFPHNLPKTF